MGRLLVGSMLVVLSFAAACVPPAPPPLAPPKPFTVRDGFIRDVDGRAVILRGVNLSGRHKDPPYFDYHQPADYAHIHDAWGMNGIRFLVSWAALEPTPDGYDDAYVEEIAKRMDWARAAGLLVVIDMHQDLYGPGFLIGNGAPAWTCDQSHYDAFLAAYDPTQDWFFNYLTPDVTACYDHFWASDDLWDHYARAVAHLAEKLVDKPAVIGVDMMNEPFWGSWPMEEFEADNLQLFYERLAPVIRAAAPGWLLFAEPASSRNLGVATGLVPLRFDDVVYAPHSYDASAERGQGFDATHRPQVLDNAIKLRAEARSLGAALWIGEYGGMADKPGITEYMDAEYDAAGAVAGSTMYWDDTRTGSYGLLNDDGSERPQLTDAVVRPYPARVDGTPTSYAFDDATRTFTLHLVPPPEPGKPTEIVLPPRIYPGEVVVQCGGCVSARDGALLSLTGAGADVSVAPAP